jgi:hypothetical protein
MCGNISVAYAVLNSCLQPISLATCLAVVAGVLKLSCVELGGSPAQCFEGTSYLSI